jgi:hypothetical protein
MKMRRKMGLMRRRTRTMKTRTRMMRMRTMMTSDPLGTLECFFSLFGVLMPKGEKLLYYDREFAWGCQELGVCFGLFSLGVTFTPSYRKLYLYLTPVCNKT